MKSSAINWLMLATALSVPAASYGSGTAIDPIIQSEFQAKEKAIGDSLMTKWFASTRNLTPAEEESMKFLYSYMILADRNGYSPEFFLENVRSSLRAAEEMPWGKTVPEREFRHFVLPVRVNNESLDMSRPVFYEELKERVKGLSMEEAILEVNHWCHEKASYQPSDSRTSNPLSTVSQAIGRCGEESTFGVAALRAVGIPARQVYTPRWAHTDDNHAWVEAWANGKWYFLGACEPEPILNLAWFNSPASRGMLMNTKAFGRYDGPEEALEHQPYATVINVTENYAPVRTHKVVVKDKAGRPVENATVNFSLYNYAEFYPVAVKKSDVNGHASLNGGMGEFVIWASDGNNFGIAKAGPDATEPVEVILDKDASWTGVMEFDIIPPASSASLPAPTAEQREMNTRRMAYEDSIRSAYISTFATPESAGEFADRLGIDKEKTVKILTESRGNHKNIEQFLSGIHASSRDKALNLLLALSEKDRRDVGMDILADHLKTPEVDTPLFDEYVMNPRVSTEPLTPYKSYFAGVIPVADRERYRKAPQEWVKWCRENIALDTLWNLPSVRMIPESVWRLQKADRRSRDVFFVASARSMGIPARIDPVTGKTQYADKDNEWVDVKFDTEVAAPVAAKGELSLTFTPCGRMVDPKYYSQFSISKIENGLPHLLEYDENGTVSSISKDGLVLDEGRYMLVSGQRMANGGVLVRTSVFNVEEGKRTEVPLIIRQDSTAVQVIGSFNAENLYHDIAENTDKSLISTTGRGYYILGIIQPNHEPSTHNLNDISAMAAEFEKWGKKIMLIFANEDDAARFESKRFPSLPSNVVYGMDINGKILNEIVENLNLPTSERPIFIIADTFNRVVFVSQGYTIGLGETMTDVLHKITE